MLVLTPARPRLIGAVVAVLALLLSLGAAPSAHAEAATHGTVTATGHDHEGNALPGFLYPHRYNPETAEYEPTELNYSSTGHWSVELPPGTYKFEVVADGGRKSSWAGGESLDEATPMELRAGDVLPLGVVVVVPLPTVRGSVVLDPPDPDREVTVGLYVRDDEGDFYEVESLTLRGGGDYEFTDVWAGVNRVVVVDEEGIYARSVGGRQVPRTGVVTFDPITVGLASSISGKVIGPDSEPLQHVSLRAFHADTGRPGWIETDDSGEYVFKGLAPGTYMIEASDDLGQFEQVGTMAVKVASRQDVKDVTIRMGPAPAPSGVDVTGIVRGTGGRPLAYAVVRAFLAAEGENGNASYAYTDRTGRFRFTDLEADSYTFMVSGPSMKADDLDYFDRWYDSPDEAGATHVSVTPDVPGSDLNVTLEQLGGLSGTVEVPAGTELDSVDVSLYDSQGRPVEDHWQHVFRQFEDSWQLQVRSGSYRIHLEAHFRDAESGEIAGSAAGWYGGASSIEQATVVTVRSGQKTEGINMGGARTLTSVSPPVISGDPVVGNTLTATTGTFTQMQGVAFAYAWLRDGATVGTASSYQLQPGDVGKSLTVRVDASLDELRASGTSVPTAPVRAATPPTPPAPPAPVVSNLRASSTVLKASKPKKGKVTLTATVKVAGVAKPTGTVMITRGGAVVGRGAVKKGKAVVRLAKQPKGAQSYQAVYGGTGAIAPSSSAPRAVKIK